MKFTVSILLGIWVAVPVAVVQALDLKVTINSTLAGGTITVFPGDPLVVGSLQLTGIGPDSYGRFDVIDTSLAPKDYTQVSLHVLGKQTALTESVQSLGC
jgi:ABC-type arginine/histidine transport system permease subunit